MQKQSKRTSTPKLRFPEFREDEEWLTPQLSDLYGFKRTNTLSRDKLNYEAGTIRNIHYGDIHTKFKPLFRIGQEHVPYINTDVPVDVFKEEDDCEEGDIVLADASEDLNDVGKAIEIISLVGQRVVAGTHTILATRHGSIPIIGFSGHLFQSAAVRTGIQRESQGAKVYGISAKRISSIALPLPPTIQEQQKIADCLSALDDLITAEAEQLEALKAHKKGLMQQLFPRDGETTPRLRFPEFRDAGEWEVKLLGKIAEIKLGKMLDKNKHRSGSLLPYLNNLAVRWNDFDTTDLPKMYFNENELEKYELKKGDVIVCEGGEPGRSAVWDERLPCLKFQKALHRVRFKIQFIPHLLVHYLETIAGTPAFKALFTGGGIKHLTRESFAHLAIPIASPAEQRRIADCLTSLDDLITAKAAKIETLKTHKKGLMQQLFPAPEGQE